MNEKELFIRALAQATKIINQVTVNDFDHATPDTEWNVRRLAQHMIYELSWTPDLVQGATIKDVGDKYDGDLIGDNLVAEWQAAAEKASHAVSQSDLTDIAHLSYADVSVADYLREAASDQLIHAWDLGVATNQKVSFDPDLAKAIYINVLPKLPSMANSRLFAAPLKVAKKAELQAKLLALFGRNSDWHP